MRWAGSVPSCSKFCKDSRIEPGSASPGNRPVICVRTHSGVSPGPGSSTGSSPASDSVTEKAPACVKADSAASGSIAPRSMTNCSQSIVDSLLQPEAFLKIMDVGTARLESCVLEDLLVQRNVGLDAFDDDFVQRIFHARKSGTSGFAVCD